MRVQMIRGVVGEDGADWLPGTVQEASETFGAWLVARGKAVAAPDVQAEPAAKKKGK